MPDRDRKRDHPAVVLVSYSEGPGLLYVAQLVIGGITGVFVGFFSFPVIATLSPLCHLPARPGSCEPLAEGPMLLLDVMGISTWTGLVGLLSAVLAVGALACVQRSSDSG